MNKNHIELLNNDSDLIFLYYLEEYKKSKLSNEIADKILIVSDLLLPYTIPALMSYLIVSLYNIPGPVNLMWFLPSICIGFLVNLIMIISGYKGFLYSILSRGFKLNKELERRIYKGDLRNLFYGSSKNLAVTLNSKYFNIKDDIKKYGGVRWETVKDVVDASVLK